MTKEEIKQRMDKVRALRKPTVPLTLEERTEKLIIRWLEVIRPRALYKNECQGRRMAKDVMKLMRARKNEIN